MDAQTRSKLKQVITLISVAHENKIADQLENFTDWVYDLAYRKGWQHGLWKKEPDYNYQTNALLRRKRTSKNNSANLF